MEYRKGSHTIYDIKYHFVWVTKYRYRVLTRPIAERLRELIKQGCEAMGITIIRGNAVKDHIHVLLSFCFSVFKWSELKNSTPRPFKLIVF